MFEIQKTSHFLLKAITLEVVPYLSERKYDYLMTFDYFFRYVPRDFLMSYLSPPSNITVDVLRDLKKYANTFFKNNISHQRILVYLFLLKTQIEYMKLKYSFDFNLIYSELVECLDKIWTKWILENGDWVNLYVLEYILILHIYICRIQYYLLYVVSYPKN